MRKIKSGGMGADYPPVSQLYDMVYDQDYPGWGWMGLIRLVRAVKIK